MPDHPALRLSRLWSMDSQRRLPRPWVCGSLELIVRSTKLILDLGSPIERVRLLIFSPTFPMGHAFCPTRLVMCFFFSLSSLRTDVRSKEHASLFCLLATISLRITWARSPQKPPGEVRLSPISTTTTAWEASSQAALFCSQESKRGKCTPTLNRAANDSER